MTKRDPTPKPKDFTSSSIRKIIREEFVENVDVIHRLFSDLKKIDDPKDFITSVAKILVFALPPLRPVEEEGEGNHEDKPPVKLSVNINNKDFGAIS